MRYSRLAVSTLVLVVSSMVAQAQTPAAARKYFQQGVKEFAQGNLGIAFENYSRAIEISSRLDSRKSATSDLLRRNSLTSSAEADRSQHHRSLHRRRLHKSRHRPSLPA